LDVIQSWHFNVLCLTFSQPMHLVAGLLHVNRHGEIEGGKARVGCYEEVLDTEGMSRQELLQLDREGRCLVTDHGSFGEFNFTSCQHSFGVFSCQNSEHTQLIRFDSYFTGNLSEDNELRCSYI
jgi:hypothetical protein